MTTIDRVLEACLYATDLEAAERFYMQVLDLERYSSVPGRHVFFRCGDGMFLVFNAERTSVEASIVGGAVVPTHGYPRVAFPPRDGRRRDRVGGDVAARRAVALLPGPGRQLRRAGITEALGLSRPTVRQRWLGRRLTGMQSESSAT
jgi:catechol 2,3-dioxygenase-like lactoylglutathione lyase family enzyme